MGIALGLDPGAAELAFLVELLEVALQRQVGIGRCLGVGLRRLELRLPDSGFLGPHAVIVGMDDAADSGDRRHGHDEVDDKLDHASDSGLEGFRH